MPDLRCVVPPLGPGLPLDRPPRRLEVLDQQLRDGVGCDLGLVPLVEVAQETGRGLAERTGEVVGEGGAGRVVHGGEVERGSRMSNRSVGRTPFCDLAVPHLDDPDLSDCPTCEGTGTAWLSELDEAWGQGPVLDEDELVLCPCCEGRACQRLAS